MSKLNNSKFFLSGGGNKEQSFLFDKAFFEHVPKNSKILYIPIALKFSKLYPAAYSWFKNLIQLHNRTDLQIEAFDESKNYTLHDLLKFEAIYIGGGNTWSLINDFKNLSFDKLLIEFSQNNRIIYGGSAGAIILGKFIDAQQDDKQGLEISNLGLNLLNGYSIGCHYQPSEEGFYKSWAIKNASNIICLTEESGIYFYDNSYEITGNVIKINENGTIAKM